MEAIKVLIVDDEHLERALIRLGIDWNNNGFEIVGEADSGQTALELVEEIKPDIVFTDICMPFMDGLELTSKLRDNYPEIKVVIITGHREFDYAKRAIRYGVNEFLLKPIKSEEILKVACQLKNEIFKEKEVVQEYAALKKQVNQSKDILKEKFILQLLNAKFNEDEVYSKLEDFNLQYLNNEVQCFCIRISKDFVKSNIEIEETLRQAMGDQRWYEFVFTSETEIAVLIGNISSIRDINGLYDRVLNELIEGLQCGITIGIGSMQHSISGLPQAFKEAMEAVKARVIYGRNQVIHYKYINTSNVSISNIFEVDWKELSFHLKNGIKDKVTGFIQSYISKVAELGNIEITTVRMLCTNIVSVLTTVLNDMGKKFSDVFEPDYDIYAKVGAIDTLQDAAIVLKEFAERLTDFINNSKGKKINELVERAKEYIEQNYTNAELNLGDIAAKLYVNQSYLSRIFKAETGESTVDYISKLRINKSIEYMATTNLKAYEIAEKVGINDSHYFSICFKKYTGQSVNEYKKSFK